MRIWVKFYMSTLKKRLIISIFVILIPRFDVTLGLVWFPGHATKIGTCQELCVTVHQRMAIVDDDQFSDSSL
jgi:hypothetical protein